MQQAWARAWLNELKDRKIRMNVLTPGQVATAKQEELFDEATRAAFESLIPRGKMGRPEEIATVALFLASDDSTTSTAWNWSPTAAPLPSEPHSRNAAGTPHSNPVATTN